MEEQRKRVVKAIFQPNKKDWMNIGEELITMEGVRIPIRAIALVKIKEKKPLKLISIGCFFLVGLILNNQDNWLQYIGSVILWVSMLKGVIDVMCYFLADHQLQLRLASGDSFCFYSKNLKFLQEVMDLVSKSIGGIKQVAYVNMEQTIINNKKGVIDMSYHYDPNVMNGDGGIMITGKGRLGKVVNKDGGNHVRKEESHVTNTISSNLLTDAEWEQLTLFFEERCQQMDNSDPQYSNCERMHEYAQRKDTHGLRTFMNQLGRDSLRFVLGQGVGRLVTELLMRVLKSE